MVCGYCGKAYKSRSDVNKHEKRQHKNQAPYKWCGKMFLSAIKMKSHRFVSKLLYFLHSFLAHLSTKCSVSFSDPSMSGVRRPSSVRPCVRASTISLNYISSETAFWILTKLHRNDPWVVPYQSCSNRSSWLHK